MIVWLRDGWSCNRRAVENEARRAGVESPTLFVFLPRRHADALKDRILSVEAAQRVLNLKGSPASPEGQDAKAGMESRREDASRGRAELVLDTLRAASVYQGGGTEVHGEDLRQRIEAGAKASVARLFPDFDKGDHRAWEVALRRARDGNDEPLQVVGWDRATADHPVAREVLAKMGAGARGTELHRAMKAAPFGWPQDAVDAVLVALHPQRPRAGYAQRRPCCGRIARPDGNQERRVPPEKVVLTVSQRIDLRRLFQELGIRSRSGEEGAAAREFLDKLRALADSAGGEAPLPPAPDTAFVEELSRLAGAEQLAAIHAQRASIRDSIAEWKALCERSGERLPVWRRLTGLLRHATKLPEAGPVSEEVSAIQAQRSLLADTDHAAPLAARLASDLRVAVTERRVRLADAVATAESELAVDTTWQRLDGEAQREIRQQCHLAPPEDLRVATDDELLASLDDRPLSAWQSNIDAVRERTSQALAEAVRRLHAEGESAAAPTSVTLRRGTLADEAAVRDWLREQEERLLEAVRKGPVVLR